MDPRNLLVSTYNYDLPENRIAKYPLAERDASKLLVYEGEKITGDIFKNLDQHLPPNSLLIFNDSRVIEARIFFQKPTGGIIEIFCLDPHEQYPDITIGITEKKQVLWRCLIGGASKWKHEQILQKKLKSSEKEILFEARYVEKRRDCFVIEFSWNDDSLSFAEILHLAGAIPLPPYIKREVEKSDIERYQTIYANYQGSVAAPTAGLHFTDDLLKKIKAKNILTDFVTLHVGAGTFKPVKTETIGDHEMHSEFITISKKTIENILENLSRNIIPVGTTSFRTLESMYWLGVKIRSGEKDQLSLSQWEPYELEKYGLPIEESLHALLDFMKRQDKDHITTKSQILIAPSYKIKMADALITNFHQPGSTLLLLVAAFIGNDWRKVYQYALENDFRFLSYGDGCLFWQKHKL